MSNLIEFHDASKGLAPGNGVYMVAGSAESRSVRATSLLPSGEFQTAVIFDYEDSQLSVMGMHHVTLMRRDMEQKRIDNVTVLGCRFDDPFATIRAFRTSIINGAVNVPLTSVTIDATCFTKLHLLLLLQYLEEKCGTLNIKVLYTEPLSYAADFGKQLSCGIHRTVYLPYKPSLHRSKGVGLVAFMGHDSLRMELIMHELSPSISVTILGIPRHSINMGGCSRNVNQSLIHSASYDRRYRIAEAPDNDVLKSRDVLLREISKLCDDGCDSIYLAALGTKLQALGIHLLLRSELQVRLLLAYAIPKRYDSNSYSHGVGSTYLCDLNAS